MGLILKGKGKQQSVFPLISGNGDIKLETHPQNRICYHREKLKESCFLILTEISKKFFPVSDCFWCNNQKCKKNIYFHKIWKNFNNSPTQNIPCFKNQKLQLGYAFLFFNAIIGFSLKQYISFNPEWNNSWQKKKNTFSTPKQDQNISPDPLSKICLDPSKCDLTCKC